MARGRKTDGLVVRAVDVLDIEGFTPKQIMALLGLPLRTGYELVKQVRADREQREAERRRREQLDEEQRRKQEQLLAESIQAEAERVAEQMLRKRPTSGPAWRCRSS